MLVKIFCISLLIPFLSLVTSAPTTSVTSLVPSINENGVLLMPSENKYYLRIITDGTTREETVEQISPDQLQVKGTYQQSFPGSKYLLVIYEAGTNGYVAKYNFSVTQIPIQRLSPATLKSASG
ncbi:uncharacterized protein LOC119549857 [Drosophila subpulchrella]|uniref:uncharacterized protein LOC119549857 n=1 Tax=Drosophila subpulchrella TaxID=1486046 RepID=UPI0018A18031|nr:uncharacterized protein LOC119549857 [Drosophila subpulchrella]